MDIGTRKEETKVCGRGMSHFSVFYYILDIWSSSYPQIAISFHIIYCREELVLVGCVDWEEGLPVNKTLSPSRVARRASSDSTEVYLG